MAKEERRHAKRERIENSKGLALWRYFFRDFTLSDGTDERSTDSFPLLYRKDQIQGMILPKASDCAGKTQKRSRNSSLSASFGLSGGI